MTGDIRDTLADDVLDIIEPGALLDVLRELLVEPVSDPTVGQRRRRARPSPPWHPEGAAAYLDIHAGARDLERELRLRVTGHADPAFGVRGGSDDNTREALRAVCKLAESVPDDVVGRAAHRVSGWITRARQSRDIDLIDKPAPLPRSPGQLPPPCDYCGNYSLRMSLRSGVVFCITPSCRDADDRRPIARIQTGQYTGAPALVWQDGRNVIYLPTKEAS